MRRFSAQTRTNLKFFVSRRIPAFALDTPNPKPHNFPTTIKHPGTLSSQNADTQKESRRSFLRRFSAILFGLSSSFTAPDFLGTNQTMADQRPDKAKTTTGKSCDDRPKRAYKLRLTAADNDKTLPVVTPCQLGKAGNVEETGLPRLIGSYSKGLPHDGSGEVNSLAYAVYLSALRSGDFGDFEKIPMGGNVPLSNPRAAYSYNLDGCDSSQIAIASPPGFESAETAAEIAELFWMAILRDIPFSAYETSDEVTQAGADLGERMSGYADRREPNGTVSPGRIFRTSTVIKSLAGPYISQFLWLDVPYGAGKIVQKHSFPLAHENYLTVYSDWLRNRRGFLPDQALHLDPTPRYIRTGRDLAEYVHRDFTYQTFLNAALISFGAAYSKHEPRAPFARGNPYVDSLTETGFSTFGGPNVLEMIPRAASIALRASWYQKWLVFRRLRPEAFAGRVHNHLSKTKRYPIHEDLFKSRALEKTHSLSKSWLLPQAYPEGAPTHPTFPAAHAAIAGACATVIKAFFDENYRWPHPIQPTEDGLALEPYRGEGQLTLGGEIDKLAANLGLGRSFAGIHWRSDSREGFKVGEAAATSLLKNWKNTTREGSDTKIRFTNFAGEQISI
jgi:hypothetical protein